MASARISKMRMEESRAKTELCIHTSSESGLLGGLRSKTPFFHSESGLLGGLRSKTPFFHSESGLLGGLRSKTPFFHVSKA